MPLAALGPILAGAAGVSGAATTAAWTAIGAGTVAGTNLIGAKLQGNAARDAAALQVGAADRAAQAQLQAQREALDFTKQQAGYDANVAEANRHANYDQYVASRGKTNSVADLLGMPHEQIPGYVPLPAFPGAAGPNGAGPTTPGAPGATAAGAGANRLPAAGSINWTADPETLGNQLTAYFKGHGVAPSEVPYWVREAGSLVARGQQLNDPQYADKRLAAAEIFGGGAASPAPATSPYRPPSALQVLNPSAPPYQALPVSPGLVLPTYRPQSAAAYLGM
jgi:hypothetical protein